MATGATPAQIQDTSLQGWLLGGLLALRYQTLDTTQNALGRGAVGSGRLRSEAYVADRLETQLTEMTAEFLTSGAHVDVAVASSTMPRNGNRVRRCTKAILACGGTR